MIEPGAVLEIPEMGVRVEVRETPASTNGALAEFDVVGRARGLVAQGHVHATQTERHQVIAGGMRLRIGRRVHVLAPGDVMEVPRGAPHAQRPAGDGEGRIRVQLRPAGRAIEFVERLARMSADGELDRRGLPKPVAAARLVEDFADVGYASGVPLRLQRALARGVLRLAETEYAFCDEWDVAAPAASVFGALANARSYPQWWRPVYLDVESDPGAAAVGHRSRQHFKGRLPYHLHTSATISRYEPPYVVAADVEGDLRGRGTWTLTELPGERTHVRFDWVVDADRPLLRALTPVLRPALRANHAWAIARAREGLEPYARARSIEHKRVADPDRPHPGRPVDDPDGEVRAA